jgi:hypothetical protein
MSIPKIPSKAKLVISFISKSEELINSCIEKAAEKFSPPDYVSGFIDFTHTHYYEDEFGGGLKRRFAAFSKLFDRKDIVKAKKFTNVLENETAHNGKRKINIDPGFLSIENFILATGKNFTHRVYLKDGIFADLTLIFTKNDFKELAWTYPDYKERAVKDMLIKIRETGLLI